MKCTVLTAALGAGFVVALTAAAPGSTVAYWQLDENGTNYVDAVGGNTLTRVTGSQTTLRAPDPVPSPDTSTFSTGTPAANPFAQSNPVGSLVNTSASAFFRMGTTAMTAEGWFRNAASPGTESSGQFILGDRMPGSSGVGSYTNGNFGGWGVWMINGQIQIIVDNGTAGSGDFTLYTSTSRYDDQAFHHFAMTWDPAADPDADAGNGVQGLVSLYIDGVLAASGAGYGPLNIGPGTYGDTFAIGARRTGPGGTLNQNTWTGQLDEIRISNAVLAPSQFLNAAAVPVPAGLPAGLALLGLTAIQSRRIGRAR